MLKEKWKKREDRLTPSDIKRIAGELHVPEIAVRIAANKGVSDLQAFFSDQEITDGMEMLDMDKAVQLLNDALSSGKHIRIIGDYDMDGTMSTHLLLQGLAMAEPGARVSWSIPDRLLDGYGLNIRLVDEAHTEGVDVILTCDNGISAKEAITHAKELGMTVIVTDHHQVPKREDGTEDLPPAEAVINPHRQGDNSPTKDICGAVVAYKLMLSLFKHRSILPVSAAAKVLLPFAAFATVTDVMPLTGENREIVKQGLPYLRHNVGMSMLCEVNGISHDTVTVSDVGFILGPCGNAAGRIGNIRDMLTLLSETSPVAAKEQAEKLRELNEKRKYMCSVAEERAKMEAEKLIADGDRVLVVYLPNVHEGIIGIVAGRLREIYNRPAFVFTGESSLKGSGRSTDTWDMYGHLLNLQNSFPGTMKKFGGHPSAAGVTLDSMECLTVFREKLNQDCNITDEELIRKIYYDLELPIEDLTVKMIQDLKYLEPCGSQNEPPCFFVRDVDGELNIIGKDLKTVRIRTIAPAVIMSFRTGDNAVEKASKKYHLDENDVRYGSDTPVKVSAVGNADINEYRGTLTPQLIAESYIFV